MEKAKAECQTLLCLCLKGGSLGRRVGGLRLWNWVEGGVCLSVWAAGLRREGAS